MPGIAVAEQAGVGVDGRPRPSEDVVVVLPHAVLLLDGATTLRPGLPSGGWYAGQLAGQLAARLTAAPELDLADLLAGSIRALARHYRLKRGECPSSTVALVRWDERGVDALVLADSPVVAFLPDGPSVVADPRVSSGPPGGYRERLRAGSGFGGDHEAAVRASAERTGLARNQPGGFWVAEADPGAAYEAVTAHWPAGTVSSVLMASDGVSCGVDDYGLFDWPRVLELSTESGPQAVLDAVRDAESGDPDGIRWPRPKQHDDQALVHLDFG